MLVSKIQSCQDCQSLTNLFQEVDATLLDLSRKKVQNLQYNTALPFDEGLYGDLVQYREILEKKIYNSTYLSIHIDVQDLIKRIKELAYKLGLCAHCKPSLPSVLPTTTTTSTSTSSTSTSSTSSTTTTSSSTHSTSSTTSTSTTTTSTSTTSSSTTTTTTTLFGHKFETQFETQFE